MIIKIYIIIEFHNKGLCNNNLLLYNIIKNYQIILLKLYLKYIIKNYYKKSNIIKIIKL